MYRKLSKNERRSDACIDSSARCLRAQDAEAGRKGLVACASLMKVYDKCMAKVPAKNLVRVSGVVGVYREAIFFVALVYYLSNNFYEYRAHRWQKYAGPVFHVCPPPRGAGFRTRSVSCWRRRKCPLKVSVLPHVQCSFRIDRALLCRINIVQPQASYNHLYTSTSRPIRC